MTILGLFFLQVPLPTAVTSYRVARLLELAWDFPSPGVLEYVGRGLDWGFDLCFRGEVSDLRDAGQHGPGACANLEVVKEYLREEVAFGSMAGPFDERPVRDLHLNRVNLISKPGKEDETRRTKAFRLIVDLSHPAGSTVNDFILEEDASVKYTGLEEIVDRIVRRGPGCLLFKLDLERAYRNVPIRVQDRWLLGIRIDDSFYVDLTLSFGGRPCARIFNTVADVINHAINNCLSDSSCLHYLDDFAGVSGRDAAAAWKDFEAA